MPSLPLLLRCLLIVALCFDTGVSQWTASAMAMTEIQQAANPLRSATASVQDDEDCESPDLQVEGSAAHHDCTCDAGSTCCACAFPAATITHAIAFAARHELSDQPAPRSVLPSPLRDSARVFRPPIG
ncbi:CopL family metal-binding regulatory protein [Lysobacter niastensis]|uniref:CopL family metal-binding regulatory protein n=1 Tax=Lysobacter niastensis TaxID=380629 RepID=A0ABS0B789_9GAMM|nr:CopL family metal-binding regulatory protein [Lysobacter niastensis]